MNDLISRQAAIDGFYEMASDMDHLCTVSDYVSFLESLSSAQPEIIRCRDCKWWDDEYRECHSPNWDTGTEDHYVTPAGFFCGWAERREE